VRGLAPNRRRTATLLCVLACAAVTAATAAPAGAVDQTDKNGCTSPEPYSGSLVSPSFMTGSVSPTVSGQMWFEVESIDPTGHDQTTVEYTTDSGATWTTLGSLNSSAVSGPSPDQGSSNVGLGQSPAFAPFSIGGLPVSTTVQVRFRFDSGDSLYQGFRGAGLDNVTLDTSGTQAFDGPGLPAGWTADSAVGPLAPSWHVITNPTNIFVKSPEINPQLVTLPDPGGLPPPAGGIGGYAWFGNDAIGSYCGPDYANRVVTPTAPDTTGSGPTGLIKDKTPTFTFSSNDSTASFQCGVDSGAFSACTSPHTVTGLSAGPHTFFVRAVSAAGVVDPTPASFSFTIAQTLADLPTPQLGRTVNVATVKGTVLLGTRSGGRVRYVPLDQARQIGVGSFLDTKRGTVRLVTATGSGTKTQFGDFSLGIFKVTQSKKKSAKGLSELPLQGGSFKGCRKARGASASSAGAHAARKKNVRSLRGVAKGKFRTRGRNASATVRGTDWTMTDRCDGTLTKVRKGRVAVRDFGRKRTILVRAGRSYLARARR